MAVDGGKNRWWEREGVNKKKTGNKSETVYGTLESRVPEHGFE